MRVRSPVEVWPVSSVPQRPSSVSSCGASRVGTSRLTRSTGSQTWVAAAATAWRTTTGVSLR